MKKFGRIIILATFLLTAIATIKCYKLINETTALINGTEETTEVNNSEDENLLQHEIAEKILRFHVLANSDDEIDQDVKLKVRDAVGKYIEPKLAETKDLNETKLIVENEIDNIVKVANQTLEDNGFSYRATAAIKETDFPEKTYGNYTFPAGKYQALQIILGNGQGHNWWCVLYPNMCFRGSVYEIVSTEAEESLREVLTEEEYEEVFNSDNFTIDFKFLEILR